MSRDYRGPYLCECDRNHPKKVGVSSDDWNFLSADPRWKEVNVSVVSKNCPFLKSEKPMILLKHGDAALVKWNEDWMTYS
jgi:hypothetical protein